MFIVREYDPEYFDQLPLLSSIIPRYEKEYNTNLEVKLTERLGSIKFNLIPIHNEPDEAVLLVYPEVSIDLIVDLFSSGILKFTHSIKEHTVLLTTGCTDDLSAFASEFYLELLELPC